MLKPEVSLPVGLGVATVVYAIFNNATPPVADTRSLPANNGDIDSSNDQAAWISAGIVSGISLIAKDPVIFWIGSVAVVTMTWWTRHANAVVPAAQAALTPTEKAVSASVTTGATMMATQPTQVFADQFQS